MSFFFYEKLFALLNWFSTAYILSRLRNDQLYTAEGKINTPIPQALSIYTP